MKIQKSSIRMGVDVNFHTPNILRTQLPSGTSQDSSTLPKSLILLASQ